MFQDADDISHHFNAHVIENVLKGMGKKLVKFVHRTRVHEVGTLTLLRSRSMSLEIRLSSNIRA